MIMYHGTSKKFNSFRKPNPKDIFWVAASPMYAGHHASHWKEGLYGYVTVDNKSKYITEEGYVYLIDVNNNVKIADFSKMSSPAWNVLKPYVNDSIWDVQATAKDGCHIYGLASYIVSNIAVQSYIDDIIREYHLSRIDDITQDIIKKECGQLKFLFGKSILVDPHVDDYRISRDKLVSLYHYIDEMHKNLKDAGIKLNIGSSTVAHALISFFCIKLKEAGYQAYSDIEHITSDVGPLNEREMSVRT